jgi:hypothetical protein
MRPVAVLFLLAFAVVGTACEDCFGPKPDPDAGTDGGEGEGEGEGEGDDGGGPRPDAGGPQCTEDTPGFGDACAAQQGDPLCGQFLCNPISDELVCADPGPNDCGVCGELDQSEGQVGLPCGEFGCGVGECNADGSAVRCIGDHPRNVCGGCDDLPTTDLPGDVCSGCGTGRQTCTRDQNQMICWRGREPEAPTGCARRILAHARMDERFGGVYVREGTVALIEDVGTGPTILTFDPLVEGTGLNGMPGGLLFLSNSPTIDPFDFNNIFLFPYVAQQQSGIGSDPIRQYTASFGDLADWIDQGYDYLALYESALLGEVFSVGVIVNGPPDFVPEFDGGIADAGFADAGVAVDAGDAGPDDGGVDGGPNDGGVDAGLDAGSSDGGVDAGNG